MVPGKLRMESMTRVTMTPSITGSMPAMEARALPLSSTAPPTSTR